MAIDRKRLTNRGLAKASLFMMTMTLASRILGLVKNIAIAYLFGAGANADAFWLALMIPGIFAYLFTTGADNYIPIFSKNLVQQGEEKAWEAGNIILTLYLVLIALGTLIGLLSVPLLVKILAPGFQSSVQRLTILLAWVMMGMSVFIGFSELGKAVLYNEEKFYAPTLGGVFNNVVILAVMIFFYQKWGIFAAAVGISLGASCQILVQVPQLWKLRRKIHLTFHWKHPAVKNWAKLTFPLYLGKAGGYLNSSVDKIFASFLPVGAISALSYGFLIVELPANVFSLSLLNALYPRMAREASKADSEEDQKIVQKALRMIALFLLPTMLLIVLLRKAIVRIIFEHGAFSAKSTEMTAVAILFYGVGILAFGLNDVLVFGFNAHHNNVDSMKIGWVRVITNIVLNVLLVSSMGLAGLALATSLSGYVKLVILFIVYQRKYGRIIDRQWRLWFGKVLAASVLMVLAVVGFQLIFEEWAFSGALFSQIRYLAGALVWGGFVFLGGAVLLRIEELVAVFHFATNQLKVRVGFQE
ncbi:MAG: murein biosynthesis integral membrane protein MurJ [Calditrichaeota bacterium]|nr:murein biosynthesis integral membrane protein MurJ [Calditrichota bacterium]